MFTLCCTKRVDSTPKHDTLLCCDGQQSGAPKVCWSFKKNRTSKGMGRFAPFGHWKSLCRRSKARRPGREGGPNLYTEPKSLETNIRLAHLQNSMLSLTTKLCMFTLCCTKRVDSTPEHDTLLCCDGQQSGAPKVCWSLKKNRTSKGMGRFAPFGHWKSLCRHI